MCSRNHLDPFLWYRDPRKDLIEVEVSLKRNAIFGFVIFICSATLCFGSVFRAKCVDALGNSVPGMKLLLVHQGAGREIKVVADRTGAITLSLPEGEYSIHLGSGKIDSQPVSVRLSAGLSPLYLIRIDDNGKLRIWYLDGKD